MKTIKTILPVLLVLITTFAARATIVFQDSVNYPYTNGTVEGQGQWYAYSPKPPKLNTFVTNNVLILTSSTTNDQVAAPLNGWVNTSEFDYASFQINVSALPNGNGGYFCQLQNSNDVSDCCHLFITTQGTEVPGSYRLGIANFSTSYSNLQPPNNLTMDLATNTWYTVVLLFDTNQSDLTFVGATLWVNPSTQDYNNVVEGLTVAPGVGVGYAYGTDTVPNTDTNHLDILISQIGFSPYVNAGISNVIAGTAFTDVVATNLPVFGVQPQPGTNYSGNPTMFYSLGSGADLAYQWYSANYGKLSDGTTFANGDSFTGSTSNILTVNNLSASDTYWCVASDVYGNNVQSSNAFEYVNTTPTAPFFPTNFEGNVNNDTGYTNFANLFTTTGFTNTALGTGPLYYQWYFASNIIQSIMTIGTNYSTNNMVITTNYLYSTNFELSPFSPLPSQTSPGLDLNLVDLTFAGGYYLTASNNLFGGSIAVSPTNILVETAPLIGNIQQLHNLELSIISQIAANPGGTITLNSNTFTTSGYMAQYQGYGSSYSEYFLADASGYGIEVFLSGHGNTNWPSIGMNVSVSGKLEIFDSALEIAPSSIAAITTNSTVPPVPIEPRLDNAIFNDLATNGLGTNGLLYGDSLVTFTNCYLYGTSTGGAFGTATGNNGPHSGVGGIFASNTYNILYFTVGGPIGPGNSNTMEIFQPAYDYGNATHLVRQNPFDFQTIPTNCYQLTGIYDDFAGSGEIIPSRLADYVTNAPPAFAASLKASSGIPTITWPSQYGSTYTIHGATNLLGPWTQTAYGVTYYPTNGTFTDTNKTAHKFYYITSP